MIIGLDANCKKYNVTVITIKTIDNIIVILIRYLSDIHFIHFFGFLPCFTKYCYAFIITLKRIDLIMYGIIERGSHKIKSENPIKQLNCAKNSL